MARYFAFPMGEMFPSGDSLARWLVTLALAMNDLTVVHVRLDEDQDNPELAFYWNQLAISHFTEAALFLGESADIEQVSSFVDALPTVAREKYDECLAIFNERRGRLFSVRNKVTSHYRAYGLTTHRPPARSETRFAMGIRCGAQGRNGGSAYAATCTSGGRGATTGIGRSSSTPGRRKVVCRG
jgi:hypothetical protein